MFTVAVLTLLLMRHLLVAGQMPTRKLLSYNLPRPNRNPSHDYKPYNPKR